MKGGDFMERKDTPQPVSPDQGRVLDEKSTPTHPLVKGRTREAYDLDRQLDDWIISTWEWEGNRGIR
ncbi:hypothetical protein A3C26_03855 [Candidatus Daviesbacteria bacterium RIFCSPHIGHO2_02_FULL_39_12]|uniref:Uncharacterized protein n=2 Tax=Candidatus Daviesiibacteriota TaxID=1752718 RepID=A0A1F5JE54_9BACT|nr:MAG: hypothetical protein A3C26_03855 [Candidatus Daviesbacteria bacterium RIFCSPHIGHO2_02_FULL_39_12]OGE72093.1 MAG: hypothetical protein A3H40_03260 [Candidatus Daviesbacteria bacterium RIFCSPLOWO2_02_FULL_38_15]